MIESRKTDPETLPKPAGMCEDPGREGQYARVQELFDGQSDEWANLYKTPVTSIGQLDLILRARIVRQFLSVISETPSPASRLLLLDVGCGSGHVLSALPAGRFRVTGMDFAEGMVRTASAAHPDSSFTVADAQHIPLRACSVDVVTLIGVLEYIPRAEQVIKSVARVLRPGGWLVVSFPNRASLFRRMHRIERCLTHPLRRLIKSAPATGGPSQDARPPYHQFQWTERSALAMLHSRGLVSKTVKYCTFGLKTPLLEGLRMNIRLCHWASARCAAPTMLTRNLAWTLVVMVQKRLGV